MKTHLDLFSGIGGFALACRWNNIQTVGFVEYEDYPRRVLSKQFPGVPLFGDIHDFDATPFRGVDLLTGGYPCQPFSQAGKRKGKEDDRHLWPEMFRVITQARPSWVLAENVAGHINLGLDEVLLDLESEGYTCRTLVLPACAKNALHRRDRCWIIAKRIHDSYPNCNRWDEMSHREFGKTYRNGSSIYEQKRDTDCSQVSSVQHSDNIRCKRSKQEQILQISAESRESMRAGTRGAELRATQSHLGRGSDGLSEGLDMPRRWGDGTWEEGVPRVTMERKNRTARLKALGNAIVPQIAYELIRCMKEIDESE